MLTVLAIFGAVWGPISERWFLVDYWHPTGLFGNPWLEDVTFGAGMSAFSGGIYLLVGRRQLTGRSKGAGWLMLAVLPAVYVAGMSLGQSVLHINSIVVSIALYLLFAVYMVVRRRDLLRGAVSAGVIMAAIAIVGYAVGLDFLVDGRNLLRTIWLLDGTALGVTILGSVPLTEVAWFACWGACFGIVFEYITGAMAERTGIGRRPRWWRKVRDTADSARV
jgi:hypothetical protein